MIPRKLRQLHSIRSAEEQLIATELNAALAELRRLHAALEQSGQRLRRARSLVAAGLQAEENEDRLAGLHEISVANRLAKLLAGWIEAAELRFGQIRLDYLAKRVERRQFGILLEKAEQEIELDDARKTQQAFDDWARSKAAPGSGNKRSGP